MTPLAYATLASIATIGLGLYLMMFRGQRAALAGSILAVIATFTLIASLEATA